MSVKRDYYEVLGINKESTPQQIEEAYRKYAVQYHPDRVPPEKKDEAREKFKEISEAYAVLSDPKKRAQYDQYGHAGIDTAYNQQDIFRGVDFGSIFEDLGFGSSTIFGDLFSDMFSASGRRRGPRTGPDLEYPLKVTLNEAAAGTEKVINLYHSQTCNTCRGSGAKAGSGRKTCSQCRGSGRLRYSQGFFTFTQTCSKCEGTGQVVEQVCPECNGRGKVKASSKITVKIPGGVDTGTSIRIKGKGEAGELGGPPGDLYVAIRVEPHPFFTRQGNDLYCQLPINFVKATLGGEITVPTLEEPIKMNIPPGTQSGKTFRLREKGVPDLHKQTQGNLYVTVNIRVPTKLTPRQRQLLQEFASISTEKDEDPDQKTDDFFSRMFGGK